MTLLQKESFVINSAGSTLASKYPELVGSPKTIMLQADGDSFYLNVGCNPMTEELFINIMDSSNNRVQGNTCLQPYPVNLLNADVFIDYVLYYRNGTFYFGLVDDEYEVEAKSSESLLEEWKNAIL